MVRGLVELKGQRQTVGAHAAAAGRKGGGERRTTDWELEGRPCDLGTWWTRAAKEMRERVR